MDDYYNEFKVKQQDQVYPVRNDREYYSKAIKLFRFPDGKIIMKEQEQEIVQLFWFPKGW